MAIFVLLVVVAVVLWVAHVRGDKPRELDSDVWVADPEERAQRLTAKTAAWRAGQTYFSPEAMAKIEVDCAAARSRPWPAGGFKIADPNAEAAKRLVRRHPMRPAG
jgi:hypothetical protein